jgi:hypothetical protein
VVSIVSLALPIVLSAVIVFVVSSVIHMALTYHRTDFQKVPKEDEVMAALRPFNLQPGDYITPFAVSPDAMKAPEFVQKMTAGPVIFMTVMPSGPPSMTASLIQWFAYSLAVSISAAYVAGRALGPGADYLDVFRFAGTAAFLAYSGAIIQNSIWYKRNWSATLKSVFDGLVYAAFTAGTFGWLWPR